MNRYARQISLPEIGEEGQAKIRAAHAAVVGCGALGSAASEMLARAGIGKLTIIDRDIVEITNLSRQSLFNEDDAREAKPKALAAAGRLKTINSDVSVEFFVKDLNWRNAGHVLSEANIIVDGTDNFETRFLINEFSLKKNVPWVYGGAIATRGMAALFEPHKTPCFLCLLNVLPSPDETPTCEMAGIVPSIVHWVASLEVTLALKKLMNREEDIPPVLYALDIWRAQVERFPMRELKSSGSCPACEGGHYPYLSGESGQRARALCGRNAVQLTMSETNQIDVRQLGERLSRIGHVSRFPSMLRFTSGNDDIFIFDDGRAIIQGTTDVERARAVFAKYVGV